MLNSTPVLVLLIGIAFVVGVESAALLVALLAGVLALFVFAIRLWLVHKLPKRRKDVVAFFHPFADGGGGGERVLWSAVQALQSSRPDLKIAIFCRQGTSPEQLCRHAQERFNLKVQPSFQVVPLSRTRLLSPSLYPRFTMLGQAWGSVRVGMEAVGKLLPGVYVDTTGWAFPYPLVWLAGAQVVAYVHYPTISTDMLERVRARHHTYNNDSGVSSSWLKSWVKLCYYQLFAALYGAVGACAAVVMVNSSWTRRHISDLWWRWGDTHRVYPPCDTAALLCLPLDRKLKRVYLVGVAQFRPEKDHAMQLRAFALARQRAEQMPDARGDAVLAARLKLVGSCRNEADQQLVHRLQGLCVDLGLESQVDFCVNVDFGELLGLLGEAVAGLHTMVDEHFGISVVEYMAAGVVPIAHDSGGPREDIVVPEGGGGSRGSGAVRWSSTPLPSLMCWPWTKCSACRSRRRGGGGRRCSRMSGSSRGSCTACRRCCLRSQRPPCAADVAGPSPPGPRPHRTGAAGLYRLLRHQLTLPMRAVNAV